MNVSLLLKRFSLVLAALVLGGHLLYSQVPGLDIIEVEMLSNTVYHDSFEHYHVMILPQVEEFPDKGEAQFNPYTYNPRFGIKAPGGQQPAINHIYYTPDPNFLGRDTFSVMYYRSFGNGLSVPAYRVYYITVKPSYLIARNDYASTVQGQPVEIHVLANDYGNGTNLVVSSIPNVNLGTVSLGQGDTTIIFTPSPGFKGIANLNYTICDAQGSCDMATVSVCVLEPTPPAYDSIFITVEKNASEVVLLSVDSNFVITQAPAHGILDTLETLVYIPDTGFVGTDKVVFTDTVNNRIRICEMRVLDVPSSNYYVVDDIVFTPVDEVVEEIHLLANDRGGQYLTNISAIGYPNTAKGGTLFYLPNVGKGVYRYTPPAGFSGVDHFVYRASPPHNGYVEYATCYIVVSNLNPAKPVYQMTTPKNTPLVLGDHLPFIDYEYTEINGADLGTVTFYPGYQTVNSPFGQTFSGTNMLVYTPDPNVTGFDEFEFKYCPGNGGNNCQLVKVELSIEDVANPQSDTLCAGSDCVWPGDTNRDGAVDMRDILPIGLTMGETGPARSGGSTSWYGQYATDWNSLSQTALDYDLKFVDVDGNGIITASDTVGVLQAYGKYHNVTPQPAPPVSSLPFYIQEPDFSNVEPGDILYAPIFLGNDSMPALDAYGLTFELEFDPTFFEDVNVYFDETSWLSYNSPVLSRTHKPILGKVDAGLTRTSGKAASGFGKIGVVEFIVIEDIIGNRRTSNKTRVTIKPNTLMNGSGELYTLSDNSLEFTMNFNENAQPSQTGFFNPELILFPNPARDYLKLHLNRTNSPIQSVIVYDALGRQVYSVNGTDSRTVQLSLENFDQGIYYVRVWSAEGDMSTAKFEVIR